MSPHRGVHAPDPQAARAVRAVFPLLMACVLAACASAPRVPEPQPEPVPLVPVDGHEFVVSYTVNDTWNAVGQILVATPGVAYETRAQMLAIYAVRYRGEAFLIRVRGLPVDPAMPALRTRVEALTSAGAPLRTLATSELLAIFGRRVPVETPIYRAQLDAQEKAEAARKQAARKKGKSKSRAAAKKK